MYMDKGKTKYKLLATDEDEEPNCGNDGNNSDSSNYSYNVSVVRNRNHK